MQKLVFFILISSITGFGCQSMSVSFSGASVDDNIKTTTIEIFENQAPLTNPNFSRIMTEGLRTKFIQQTRLKVIPEGGDVNFKGAVTGYSTTPVAVSGNETASLTRLTITVAVEYTNKMDEKKNFNQTFSRYADFNSTQNLNQVEDALMTEISNQLVQDIFNRAFLDW
jgi:hypothetical protein